MKLIAKTILLMLLLSQLSACGFHLRGQTNLPDELKTLYVKSDDPYGPLAKQLKQMLTALDINVADEAPITLHIIDSRFRETESVVSANTQVRELYLEFLLNYQLLNKHGKVILPSSRVKATRNFTSDSNRSLGTAHERRTLEKEMRRDAIFQLINRLNSNNTRAVLSNENKSRST